MDARLFSKKQSHGWPETLKQLFETRKSDSKSKKPGAIEPGEPRIIWVKMVTRPFIKDTDKGYMFTQCATYNKILESVVLKFLHTHIMDINLPVDGDMFEMSGNLSPKYGRAADHQPKQAKTNQGRRPHVQVCNLMSLEKGFHHIKNY